MFKKNDEYRQFELFGFLDALSEKQQKMLSNSIEQSFFVNIFSKIDESRFKDLYSSNKSRPNVPVNQLVGSLVLKHLKNWTYEELFQHLNFNLLTRYAIGIRSMETAIFSQASIFNFQNKIIDHYVKTGTDLLTEVFDGLTSQHLKEFGIKTNIQRGDSFLMGSNIFDYTRLQLLIEVLLRLFRALDDQDKALFSSLLDDYTQQTSGQYIYKVEKENLPKEIDKLAAIYHELYLRLNKNYHELSVFKIFSRVYSEHFVVVDQKVEVVEATELTSSILMSPDDPQATYRDKRNQNSKGYSGHVSETANPENELNLITDIAVTPNNLDDAKILEQRLPQMLDKTPDLEEYHSDGGYGSPEVDILMEDNSIRQIQTALRGKKAFVKFTIQESSPGAYWVECEHGQKVKAETIKEDSTKGYKAVFDHQVCLDCPLKDKCRARVSGGKTKKKKRTWYFSQEKVRLHKRQQNINGIPKERRTLRANVEATVKELKRGVKDGKIRVRGQNRANFYLQLTAIGVNLTRIHKYSCNKKTAKSQRLFEQDLAKEQSRQNAKDGKMEDLHAKNSQLAICWLFLLLHVVNHRKSKLGLAHKTF